MEGILDTEQQMNVIRVPRAHEGLSPIFLDMKQIYIAYNRLNEIAFVNSARAPELLVLFTKAYLDTHRYYSLLEYELSVANRKAEEAKAIAILDKLPEVSVSKGWATTRSPLGSEDIRQAFLAKDLDYQKALDLVENIKAHSVYLKGLLKGFENAYNSVKKIIGNEVNRPNPYLPISNPNEDVVGDKSNSSFHNGDDSDSTFFGSI